MEKIKEEEIDERLEKSLRSSLSQIEYLELTIVEAIELIGTSKFYVEDLANLNSDVLAAQRELDSQIESLELILEENELLKINSQFLYSKRQFSKELRSELKKANQKYRSKEQMYLKQMREFLSGENRTKKRRALHQGVGRAKYMKESLARTRKNLKTDLDISEQGLHILRNSTAVLRKTAADNVTIKDDAGEARGIIGRLDKTAVVTHTANVLAFFFFLFCAFWVINKRFPVILMVRIVTTWVVNWVLWVLDIIFIGWDWIKERFTNSSEL